MDWPNHIRKDLKDYYYTQGTQFNESEIGFHTEWWLSGVLNIFGTL